jgi:hypothetical protein
MNIMQEIQSVRNGAPKIKSGKVNGLTPVIVRLPLSKRKSDLGIQFWNDEQIECGIIYFDAIRVELVELF